MRKESILKNRINSYIDHTILKPDANEADIVKLCDEAKQHNFYAVCVNPAYIPLAVKLLADSDVKVATVIGFPLGANSTDTKAFETKNSIEAGAHEIDMVINVGKLKDNDTDYLKNDISAVVNVAKANNALVKLIIETCLLTDEEIVLACNLAIECGVDIVKTSTGFSTSGASVEHIKIIKSIVKEDLGIKASGGVKSYEDAVAMINEGATRIGTSSGVKICENVK